MLGWEFPPLVSGGLGTACHAIACELKSHVDLTLIVPRADPGLAEENLQVIGLNTLGGELIKKYRETTHAWYEAFPEVYFIEVNIDPYETDYQLMTAQHAIKKEQKTLIEESEEKENIFSSSDEPYGNDLQHKINQYNLMVMDIAKDITFDIIYAHDWMTFTAAMQLQAYTGKPFVAHVHSLEVNRKGDLHQTGIFHIEQKAMDQADAVITVSHQMRGTIGETYGIYPGKIYAVHHGHTEKKGYRKASGFDEKIVLFLGRITHQKGPEIFFDIASQILDHDSDVRFITAGTGSLKEKLVEMAAFKRIGHKFHFTGFLDEEHVRELLAIADVLVMPSVDDPFGIAALEAAEFGVPCVISEESGAKEVLKSALKAHYWDTNKMAAQVMGLLKYDTVRQQIVENTRKDISGISWPGAAEKIAAIHNQLLN